MICWGRLIAFVPAQSDSGIENAAWHPEAHSGMFKGPNESLSSPVAHGQVSLGYDCELLTGLSLKNVICSEELHKLWYSLILDVKKLS